MAIIGETGVSTYVTAKINTGKKIVNYEAAAEIEASESDKKECYVTVYDTKIDPKKGDKAYSEDLTQEEGEEYLKALMWTERCSNGIHIMYYTPR